ncbi:MAG: DUF6597 domain-containing transcriptional factor [Streptosporangiaceae bacterium]
MAGVLAKRDTGPAAARPKCRPERRACRRPPPSAAARQAGHGDHVPAGEQPRTSVEKILPGPETGLWVNLNRDAFRSFSDTGQVHRVPGAMVSGPAGRASVIEFEEGHAHVAVTFALGGAHCFFAPPLAAVRDELVPVEALWGRSGAPAGTAAGGTEPFRCARGDGRRPAPAGDWYSRT